MGGVAAALAGHAFEHLFIECLGWDRLRATTAITVQEATLRLTTVGHKRDFPIFHCPADRTVLANRRLLRDVQRQLRRRYHEHILIYSCETPRKQVWQWATTVADGCRILHREHPFFSSDPPQRLVERLEGLKFSLQEEEKTTLSEVLHRVRAALLPDSGLNLFARYPSYAVKSDRLAMAMKRGEPGAYNRFVEFHMPLARHSSRMLIRWFGMDPDDAEQTAMIGLMEAARRFDPERGYQFSTYAGYWLRQICQRYGLEWGLLLHVPTHYFWTCYKLEFIETELIAAHGQHEATCFFSAKLEEAGITPQQWQYYKSARHFCRFSDLDPRQLTKIGGAGRKLSYFQEKEEIRLTVERILNSLHPKQAKILKMRYGIGHRECTLQEIGEHLGITRERVRQIQKKAEEKAFRLLRLNDHSGDFGP